ncbi:MAG TPA: hypothetical protein VHK91_09385, partial [Flavisolibacter sp.]|nr:hypothetical protein [Flavisolibacter sp.]
LLGTFLVINLILEPTLRKKLHTLIIQGSDSLYTYSLGRLNANFFGGDIAITDLNIAVDSARYRVLKERNALPSLTMQLSLKKGHIKGISILGLFFQKKIKLREIFSSDADIVLSRHVQLEQRATDNPPLWKAMQPSIKGIEIGKVNLGGIKLLYKNADTATSVKLQFDRFDASLNDIVIDSLAAIDTTRIGFAKDVTMKFHDLKFRTPDSSYKMKAEWITYSSRDHVIEIDSFKLQPTLEKEDFYASTGLQQSLYYVEFEKIRLVNAQIAQFIHKDILEVDSIIIAKPDLEIYLDKTQEKRFDSKIGKFPHQQLLKAKTALLIRNLLLQRGSLAYTEKSGTGKQEEGTLTINNMNIAVQNATNMPAPISRNHICTAMATGNLFGSSPIETNFSFYLDSSNGRFDVKGTIKNVAAAQVNPISEPLANVVIPSLQIQHINFQLHGEDFTAYSDVQMRYSNLSLILRKTDEETGETRTKKFLTKLVNRYAIRPSNPGPDGIEKQAHNIRISRLTTQSFFGLIWKAIFGGMQDIMLNSAG